MATYGKKLLDSEGNIILPKTRSSLVYMDDNETLENTIKKILSGETTVGKANKLATARNIGNATFDGSGDITLAQIGALETNVPYPMQEATPQSTNWIHDIDIKYYRFGHLIFVIGSFTTSAMIRSGGTITAANGFPLPSSIYQNHRAPLSCGWTHAIGALITEAGNLNVYTIRSENTPEETFFATSGFYYTDS